MHTTKSPTFFKRVRERAPLYVLSVVVVGGGGGGLLREKYEQNNGGYNRTEQEAVEGGDREQRVDGSAPLYAPIDLCSFFCLDNVPHVVM